MSSGGGAEEDAHGSFAGAAAGSVVVVGGGEEDEGVDCYVGYFCGGGGCFGRHGWDVMLLFLADECERSGWK